MQRKRDDKDLGDQFGIPREFGSFGGHSTMMPSIFGGKDPFDDPFFTRPMGSMFGSSIFPSANSSAHASQNQKSKGVVIEELDSDDDEVKDDGPKDDKTAKLSSRINSNQVPSVEHPNDDDSDEVKCKPVNHRKGEGTQPQSRSFSTHTCKVTYGGVDGAYYTSSRTTRTGVNGVVVEEAKEADTTTRQATHRISRGIYDKGHSVVRKIGSDGKVDTLQTLHNLNEDELTGFEKAWKGNAIENLPDQSDGPNRHGSAGYSSTKPKVNALLGSSAVPYMEKSRKAGEMGKDVESTTDSSRSKSKNIVRINIE